MIEEVALISVPHSGTTFTIQLLKQHGFKDVSLNGRKIDGKSTLYQGHMTSLAEVQHATNLARRMPLVIPLRHPYRVEESWKRRNKDLKPMYEAFERLQTRLLKLEPLFLPVDDPLRDQALGRISKILDVELETDWPIVRGLHDTHDIGLEDLYPTPETRQITKELGLWQ